MTRIWYYRMLGAKIGKGAIIEQGTTLGEYDLLKIGDNVHLDRCICRPFAAERNTSMYLGSIIIGARSSVGLKSHVTAGSILPEDTFIGANSSSYEMDDGDNADRRRLPKKNLYLQLFAIFPIQIFVAFFVALPWMGGLFGIVMNEPHKSTDSVREVITWWATPHRISYHYLAQALNVAVRPFFWFGFVVLVKKILNVVVGPTVAKPADEITQGDRFRTALLDALIPHGGMKSLTKLFGSHYEVTSMAVRAMGGKVGKRVYWPGTGPSIHDFDLLDVGDDVVFGSRSHIITSDAAGSDLVRIGNGAMIADRVVLSPGASVGERTVLGSGAFIRRNQHCIPDSVWVGNRKGSAVCLSSSTSSTTDQITPSEHDLEKRSPYGEDSYEKDFENSGFSDSVTEFGGSPRAESTFKKSSFKESVTGFSGSPRADSIFSTTGPSPSYPSSVITKSPISPKHSRAKLFFGVEMNEKSGNRTGTATTLASCGNSISSHVGIEKNINVERTAEEEQPSSTSSSPFGRAFYEGKAPYFVFGQTIIFIYSTFIAVFVQLYWNIGTISTVILNQILNHTDQLKPRWYRPLKVYCFDIAIVSVLCIILTLLSLTVCIIAKWALLGRRKVGSYDWDKSSYCQRWQLFLTIEAIRRRCFGGNGVLGLLTGTHYAVLYFRLLGAKIGKDCALFAGGRPSLVFTEPDLLTLGDRVTTDDASLVGHINSRGKFSLNALSVGDRSVLRSGSRLLSGAKMGSDCILLEHTLIMAGDEGVDGGVYQGWPADLHRGDRLRVRSKLERS